jgi:hypothetical protein
MLKARTLIIVLLTLGVASIAWAQQPAQLKFSRLVDLTIPIESNMPGIPGIKTYADNPSKVDVVTAITEAQKSQLQTEGMTLNSSLAVNGRAMISVLSILVHNGTHIDAPRHMMEKGSPIDQMPLGQLVKEGVLINVPNKGPNSVVTVKDIEESGVEHRLDHFALSFRVHAGQALAIGGTVAHELPASFLHLFDGSGKMLAHQRIERDGGFDAGGVEHICKAPQAHADAVLTPGIIDHVRDNIPRIQ